MPDDMSIEHGSPREQLVAERYLKRQKIKRPDNSLPSPDTAGIAPIEPIRQAYDLFVEKAELKADIVRKQREVMKPQPTTSISSEEAKPTPSELIASGRVRELLVRANPQDAYQEIMGRSRERIAEIDKALNQTFSIPGMYDAFVNDLSRQVRFRHQAREVQDLTRFSELTGVTIKQLTRKAQVEGYPLTKEEKKFIEERQKLIPVVEARRTALLSEPEVFDHVRNLQLKEYREQFRETGGKFVATPSRREYIRHLEDLWSQGKKVLLTGATGVGKTELFRFARREFFGSKYAGDKFEITGHREMTAYELLGKTGFKVKAGEGGDVYRPSKLVQAMIAFGGEGAPFLYDEMDAAPNEANMAIKTILNDGPGDPVSVQMDTYEKFVIGENYSFTGTANIKSDKHKSRFEIDPAIVRVLESRKIGYLPPGEVWDICLASLLDNRGRVPLSQADAEVALKALCDAASWTQQAYLGQKVITDPRSDKFLEQRGQASTGKPATLQEAILDPGKVVKMLQGWGSASALGVDFRTFINDQLVNFINNENYPEEDRYYLVEIFAIKGFLRGHSASEFNVNGLTDQVLRIWIGTQNARKEKSGQQMTLTADKVAGLDPYKRFKRPSSKDAEDLLEEEETQPEIKDQTEGAEITRAKEILGKDFLGEEAVRTMEQKLKNIGVNVEFNLENLPLIPYSEQDLKIAQQNGEMLVVRAENMHVTRGNSGGTSPTDIINFRELFRRDPLGKLGAMFYSFSPGSTDWYKGEDFATKGKEIKFGWALVKKDVLQGSTSRNWNQQEDILKQYADGLRQKGATSTEVRRRTAAEVVWDEMLYYVNTGEQLLPDKYDWTQTRASVGALVCVGRFVSGGLDVAGRRPDVSHGVLGVCPSR